MEQNRDNIHGNNVNPKITTHSSDIVKERHLENRQLRWYRHVKRMLIERWPNYAMLQWKLKEIQVRG